MQEVLAVALLLAVAQVSTIYFGIRLFRQNEEAMRLLASKNFSEYSQGVARMAKASPEQKQESYDQAFLDEE